MEGTRLVLVRHGESEWNAAGILQGHLGPGLTARGKAQAELTADFLVARYGPALVARSDLERVAETAAPLVQASGAGERIDERLREIDLGWWAGKTRDEVAAIDPEAVAAWERGEDVRRGGAETFGEVQQRMVAALDDLAASVEPGSTVFVVSHGGPIRVAVAAALGVPFISGEVLAAVANCSLSVLQQRSDRRVLVSYNGTDHLEDLATAGTTDEYGRA